jgi:hypothetical protein
LIFSATTPFCNSFPQETDITNCLNLIFIVSQTECADIESILPSRHITLSQPQQLELPQTAHHEGYVQGMVGYPVDNTSKVSAPSMTSG